MVGRSSWRSTALSTNGEYLISERTPALIRGGFRVLEMRLGPWAIDDNRCMSTTEAERRLGTYEEAAALVEVAPRTLHRRAVEGLISLYGTPKDKRRVYLDLDEVEAVFASARPIQP